MGHEGAILQQHFVKGKGYLKLPNLLNSFKGGSATKYFTITSAPDIDQWVDQRPGNTDYLNGGNGTAANKPHDTAEDYALMDGVNDYFGLPTIFTAATAFTFTFVLTGWDLSSGRLTSGPGDRIQITSSTNIQFYSTSGVNVTLSQALTAGDHILSVVRLGTTYYVYCDNFAADTQAVGGEAAMNISNIGSTSTSFGGTHKHILIHTDGKAAADIAKLHNSLNSTYGVY